MIKLLNDIQLTDNFTLDEFVNHLPEGNIVKLDMDLTNKLEELRKVVGPIKVTSGYRTKEFNKKVGGSKNSYHLDGLAADIEFNFGPWNTRTLLTIFKNLGFKNATVYVAKDTKFFIWCHVDIGVERVPNGLFRVLLK